MLLKEFSTTTESDNCVSKSVVDESGCPQWVHNQLTYWVIPLNTSSGMFIHFLWNHWAHESRATYQYKESIILPVTDNMHREYFPLNMCLMRGHILFFVTTNQPTASGSWLCVVLSLKPPNYLAVHFYLAFLFWYFCGVLLLLISMSVSVLYSTTRICWDGHYI